MPPQTTVMDPLIQLLTGSSGSEKIRYEDHYNEANCLNLNIYMPSQVPRDAKLPPVMVFIFGGGLKSGGNGVPLYDRDKEKAYLSPHVYQLSWRYNSSLKHFMLHHFVNKTSFL